MALWKVEIYDNREDAEPSRWGVMVAESEGEAQDTIIRNMGVEERVDAKTVKVSEITSLPAGTFFWSADNA